MRYLILIVFFIASAAVHAQTQLSKKAEKEWFDIRAKAGIRHYETVIPMLESFLASNKHYVPAQKLLTEALMATARYEQALKVMQEVLSKGPAPEKDWLAMKADVHRKLQQYDEAIESLKLLREWPHLGLSYQKLVDEQIERIQYTRDAIRNPVPFTPFNLGDQVNTEFFELYPQLSPQRDRLYFTRKERNEDLFMAEWQDTIWGNVQPLPFNTTENEGAHTVSADGRFLFFTACNRQGGLGSCDIFYAMQTPQGWTKPAGIGAPINSTDWESQPCFAANGMAMLFSSNRPGGFGGKDLYIAYLDKNFKWQEPLNLGSEINTKGDEETPFLHADGRTLFFSSNGHPAVGGKDLFVTRLEKNGKWSKPFNLGFPINTEADESALFVELDGKTAYLASDRPGGFGQLDLYRFELNENVQAAPATYVKAKVKHAVTGQALQAEFRLAALENDELFAEGFTAQNGELLVCMPIDKEFAMRVQKPGFVFHSEHFKVGKGSVDEPFLLEIALQPITEPAVVILKNVFFAFNSHALQASSYAELDKVVAFLQEHPNLWAEISGHTDNVGDEAYNKQLSQKRAESVVTYLTVNGINRNRLSAVGFGAARPIAGNDTEDGRSQNRRTEFKVYQP